MKSIELPNMLLIAGTGRNSGKTTLACSIFSKFSTFYTISAIKISPHFHNKTGIGTIVYEDECLVIAEETDKKTGKDSSRMLLAGAVKSFFVMTSDEYLPDAMQRILPLLNPTSLIICESGGLRNIVKPGLFFIVNHAGNHSPKPESVQLKEYCDCWVTYDGNGFDLPLNSIQIENLKWSLKNKMNTFNRTKKN
jgi:hypothetical protein